MKKVLSFASLVFLSFSLVFVSCSKDDDNSPAPKTKTELIAQSTWKFDKATAGLYGDISAYIDACYKDNIFTFQSNGNGNVNEATVICSPTTAGNFTWSFQSNETILNVSASLLPTGSNNFNIVTLNETNFVLSQNVTLPAPINQTVLVEFTLKH